jgi:hypothetical protein
MDVNLIKRKLQTLQSTGQKKEKVDYSAYLWKPKSEGKYEIRIVPSKFDSTNPFTEVFLHYGMSKFPIYALTNWGEKDPIVEFAKQLRGTNDRENWSLAKKLDPKLRVFAPVVVRGEEEKGVRMWEFGKEIYMQLLALADDEDYGDFTDVNEGFDFTIEAVPNDRGKGYKIASIRPKRKESPLSKDASQIESWLENQPDILEIQGKFRKSFDDIKLILQNFLDPQDEDESTESEGKVDVMEELEETPKSNFSLSAKKDLKKPVDKFDELFDDEEEDDLPF